jgi:hypothetical protein
LLIIPVEINEISFRTNTNRFDPSIIKAGTALKKFKVQLEKDSIPTSFSICMFLGEMHSELARALHTTDTKRKSDLLEEMGMLHNDIISATDTTLNFLIRQMKIKVKHEDLLNTINEAPQGKSMMVMAAELVLKESLALMVTSGATLGPGTTPKDVFAGVETMSSNWQDQLGNRWHMGSELNDVRGLLDLSTIFNLPGHYSSTIRHLVKSGISSVYPIMKTAPICSLVGINDLWMYRTLMPDELGWIHVPLTNVSKIFRPLPLVMRLIGTGVNFTSTTARHFRDISHRLRIS